MTDRRTFLRELSQLTFERATPEVRRHFLALFADRTIDWQDLARPVASLLLRDEDEELLDAYLRHCVNTSWELEQRLIALRRDILGVIPRLGAESPAVGTRHRAPEGDPARTRGMTRRVRRRASGVIPRHGAESPAVETGDRAREGDPARTRGMTRGLRRRASGVIPRRGAESPAGGTGDRAPEGDPARTRGMTRGVRRPSAASAARTRRIARGLAIQAFLNGYLWPDAEEETRALETIDDPLLRAMYRPPDRGTRFDDPDLQRILIDEPAEEARLAATLTDEPPFDSVTAAVRAQYEQHPFPRWLSLHRPDRDPDATPRRALVAGCGTGREAIALALRHPAWQIDAVDVSRRSLGYAMRKARELGASNVTFRLADLRRIGGRYDAIHAIGVLHHLADPAEGMRALRRLLAPDGSMTIGVYSRRARASLARLRELGGNAEPRMARARIFAALDDRERAALESIEFFELGHFIDTLYHAHEIALTPLELQAMLGAAGLTPECDLAEWEARELEDPSLFRNMIRCRVTIAP